MNDQERYHLLFDTLREQKVISNKEILEIMQGNEAELGPVKRMLLKDDRLEADGVTGIKFIEPESKGFLSSLFGKKEAPKAFEQHYDVFISYSRKNLGYIESLYEGMMKHQGSSPVRKLRFFFDKRDIKIGEWAKELDSALKNSTGQLVGISDHYFNSDICRKEWRDFIAYEPGKKMVRASVYGLLVESTELIDTPNTENEWAEEIKTRQLYLDSRGEDTPDHKTIEYVHEALCLIMEKAERAHLPLQNNLPVLNHRKLPRLAHLSEMHKSLFYQPREKYPAVFLVGDSGTGKTTLAITYAETYADQYPGGAFLVEADSIFDLDHLPVHLLEVLGEELTAADRMDNELITRKLNRKLEGRGKILFILDHIKNTEWLISPSQLRERFRADAYIHWLLLTDRLAANVEKVDFRYVEIGNFTREEALHLLDSYKPIISEEDNEKAQELLKVTGLRPLNVLVLGAFLFSDSEDTEEVLGWEPKKDNYKLLLTDLVSSLSPLEQTILENVTYFPHNGIMPELLFEFERDRNSHKRGVVKTSPEEFKEAFRHLELLGFFTRNTEKGFYSIPEDIHKVLSSKLTNEYKKVYIGEFLMSKIKSAGVAELPVFAHVIFNSAKSQEFKKIDSLIYLLCKLIDIGLYNTGLFYLSKCLGYENWISKVDYAHLLLISSEASSGLGLYKDAIFLIERCIKIYEKLDPEKEGDSLAASYHQKSRVLERTGRNEAALVFIDAAIKIYEKLDPEKDGHSLAASYNQKSVVLEGLGRNEAAMVFIDAAIKIEEKLDPEKEGDSLAIYYHQKSIVLQQSGRNEDALLFIDAAIKIKEKLDPEKERAFLASSYHQKSIVLQQAGRNEDALLFIDAAIKIKEKLDPEKEGDFLAASYHQKSIVLRKAGRNEAAMVFIDAAIKIEEKLNPEKDGHSLAAFYHQKSIVLEQAGRNEDALLFIDAAIKIEEKLNPEKDGHSLAAFYHQKSIVLRKAGRNEAAMVFIDGAIKIEEKLDPEKERAFLATFYHQKSIVLEQAGRNEDALVFIDGAIKIKEKLDFEKEGDSLAASYYQKSIVLEQAGRNEDALLFIDAAIKIEEKLDQEKNSLRLGRYYFTKSRFLYGEWQKEATLFMDKAMLILNNYPDHLYYKEAIDFKNKIEEDQE